MNDRPHCPGCRTQQAPEDREAQAFHGWCPARCLKPRLLARLRQLPRFAIMVRPIIIAARSLDAMVQSLFVAILEHRLEGSLTEIEETGADVLIGDFYRGITGKGVDELREAAVQRWHTRRQRDAEPRRRPPTGFQPVAQA